MVGFLTQREADYCQSILDDFESGDFLPALTGHIRNVGMSTATMPYLFELRYAKALRDIGIVPEYERVTLEASSVDFAYQMEGYPEVFAELVSIGVSDITEKGTQHHVDENGIQWNELLLCTNNDNPKLSEEGEVLLVQQKICEKAYRNGRPVKFSPTQPNRFHVIVVDMRGFLSGNGGDNADCVQLCYGNAHVPEFFRRFWRNPQTNQMQPILGLFENTDRPRGAPTLRERIHGILFIRDTTYEDGGLQASSFLTYNPQLITTEAALNQLRSALSAPT